MVAGGRAYAARLPVAAVSGVPSLKFAPCRIIRRAGPGAARWDLRYARSILHCPLNTPGLITSYPPVPSDPLALELNGTAPSPPVVQVQFLPAVEDLNRYAAGQPRRGPVSKR